MADEKCHDLMRWFKYFFFLVMNGEIITLKFVKNGVFLQSCQYEPRHEKTCLQGLRPGKTQTGLPATEAR